MTTIIMTTERIQALNDAIVARLNCLDIHEVDRLGEGPAIFDAIHAVIRVNGLVKVEDRGHDREIYQAPDCSQVNVWVGGDLMGFDDQVDD